MDDGRDKRSGRKTGSNQAANRRGGANGGLNKRKTDGLRATMSGTGGEELAARHGRSVTGIGSEARASAASYQRGRLVTEECADDSRKILVATSGVPRL